MKERRRWSGAAKELDDIYNKIIGSKESYLIPSYAKENKNELVAEMANPAVREPLKKMGMWTRLVNAVKKFFTGEEKQVAVDAGFAKEEDFGQSTVYNELSKTLDKFLNNFDEKSYDAYVALCGGERHGKHFRTEDKNSQSSTPVTDTVANIGKVVEKTSKKLGVKVHAVSHISEITDPQVRRDIMRGKKVQGWYDEKTGEVHLYLPNIHDSYTAEKTVWHETVGHKGMRGLLGDLILAILQVRNELNCFEHVFLSCVTKRKLSLYSTAVSPSNTISTKAHAE